VDLFALQAAELLEHGARLADDGGEAGLDDALGDGMPDAALIEALDVAR
jgi:hypothetical protein